MKRRIDTWEIDQRAAHLRAERRQMPTLERLVKHLFDLRYLRLLKKGWSEPDASNNLKFLTFVIGGVLIGFASTVTLTDVVGTLTNPATGFRFLDAIGTGVFVLVLVLVAVGMIEARIAKRRRPAKEESTQKASYSWPVDASERGEQIIHDLLTISAERYPDIRLESQRIVQNQRVTLEISATGDEGRVIHMYASWINSLGPGD